MSFESGKRIVVAYTGYHVEADVVRDEGHGWLIVRQVTDFRGRRAEDRPEYAVAVEFVSLPGEPLKPGPFELPINVKRRHS